MIGMINLKISILKGKKKLILFYGLKYNKSRKILEFGWFGIIGINL